MYLHLGRDTVVPTATVIGIFDLDNTSTSATTRQFLKKATDGKQIINISEELPKSFVICEEKGSSKVYISQLASSTLLRRLANNNFDI